MEINPPKNESYPIKNENIELLLSGLHTPADINAKSDFDTPAWFDKEKYIDGQKCAQKYFTSISFAGMLSLMMLFLLKEGLNILIFTMKSSSIDLAYKRYLSTIRRVRSWYTSDLLDWKSDAGKSISYVRTLHRNAQKNMNTTAREEIEKSVNLKDKNPICPVLSILQKEFTTKIQVFPGQCPNSSLNYSFYLNQFEMAWVQFGFVGLFVLYPEKFGTNVTEKEMEGFVHLWAIIGYLLGTDDKYNICIDGYQKCREICLDLVEFKVKANLRELWYEWVHMSKSAVEGISKVIPGQTFESSVMYLCWALNISINKFKSKVAWKHKLLYYWNRVVFGFLLRVPGIRNISLLIINYRINCEKL